MAVSHKDTLIKDIIYYIPEAAPELQALPLDIKDAIERGITLEQACREHGFDPQVRELRYLVAKKTKTGNRNNIVTDSVDFKNGPR